MSATLVSAYAAVAAVVFGVVNVALAAHLVRRQERHKQAWQHLPAVIEAFGDASFRFMREVWAIDWDVLPPDSRGDHGMDEAKEVMLQLNKLEVFAHPETIRAARDTLHAADAIRLHYCNRLEQGNSAGEKCWDLYESFAKAHHAFLVAARRELGLKPPPPFGFAVPREDPGRLAALRSRIPWARVSNGRSGSGAGTTRTP
ncbi:hypothetical protein OHT20_17740 [Streptomyces caniferus]|uniref:hypothetical protein n=1 Tax=Streptomyces caniferus TaxID=285557 RepID=UPI002E2B6CC2|nr:hypothetical protein [Streptomyces caniferus]